MQRWRVTTQQRLADVSQVKEMDILRLLHLINTNNEQVEAKYFTICRRFCTYLLQSTHLRFIARSNDGNGNAANVSRRLQVTTHRCHWIDGHISRAGLQLKGVPGVNVSHRGVGHGSCWALRLDRVTLRGPLGPHGAAVELGFLKVALGAGRRRRGRVVGLGAGHRLHGRVLAQVGVLIAGKVRRRLHGLTPRVIQTLRARQIRKKEGDHKFLRENNKLPPCGRRV